ncbi:MAG: M48 family metalloprotease, partial [Nitrospinota bacterium]
MRERSKEYSRLKLRLRLISAGMGLVFLAFLTFTGLSLRLRAAIPGGPLLQVAGYFILLLLIWEGISFPLSLYGGYRVEHRYGLSRENLWSWVWDYLKSIFLSLALGLPLVEGLYWLLREGGGNWWLYAAGGAIVVGVLMTKLSPVLLAPLFYKFTPLGDEQLERELLSLASLAGVKARGVFRMGLGQTSRKAAAGLAGLGRTRRIILSDTLLEGFDREEIGAVLAHELGHHAGRHIGKTILIQSAFLLGIFYLLHRVLSLSLAPL